MNYNLSFLLKSVKKIALKRLDIIRNEFAKNFENFWKRKELYISTIIKKKSKRSFIVIERFNITPYEHIIEWYNAKRPMHSIE